MKNLLQLMFVVLIAGMVTNKANAQCGAVGNGTGGGVFCLYHDSLNNCLYVGGGFQHSGNDSLNHCGVWNDSLFTPMGGMGMNGTNDSVWCFTWFNGNLYVGGSFTQAGGTPANRVAMWDGTSWYAVGDGFNDAVYALEEYNGQLYAGGKFTASGSVVTNYIAYWDGSQWLQTGGGTNGFVRALHEKGNNLYLGGAFTEAGGITVNHICYWDGSNFNALGNGFTCSGMSQCSVNTLCTYNGNLYAGGTFHGGMNNMQNIAMWNGMNWNSMGNIQGGQGGNNMVNAMCVYGGLLYVGGNFGSCGGQAANNLSIWDGSSWSSIGTGTNGKVSSLAVFNNKLFIGGIFTDATGTSVSNIAYYDKLTGITPQEVYSPYIIYSNPSYDEIQIRWIQDHSAPVEINVYDIIGKEIYSYELGTLAKGIHNAAISADGWRGGIYLVIFKAGNVQYANKIVISR